MSWEPPWGPGPPQDGHWVRGQIEHYRELENSRWIHHFKCDACKAPACNLICYGPFFSSNGPCYWSCDAHVEQVYVIASVIQDRGR